MGEERLRFAVLGPVRAWYGDVAVDLGPSRQQAVLAALLLRPNAVRSATDLLSVVWGGEPPASGKNVVSVYLYRLRAALRAAGVPDEVIRREQSGYRFAAAAEVDAARLEELIEQAATASAEQRFADAEAALTEATGLFTGDPLAGLPGSHATAERQRLRDRGRYAWRRLAELWIRQDRAGEAVDALARLVAENPYDEPLAALLMRAHYRGGWVADALQDYRDLRDRMVGDLGVEPGQELRALHQAVLREDDAAIGLEGLTVPVVRTPESSARNELPSDIPHLEGREHEVEELLATLNPDAPDAPHLVAVIGIAGIGKSALVVRLAHLLYPSYPDGALFLDLHGYTPGRAPLSAADGLHRLLRTVGVPDRDVPDELDERAALWRASTADSRLLLVLDNAASSDQLRPLLPGGAGNRVLVTSRARLADLDPDQQFPLDALPASAASALLARLVGQDKADAEPDAVREVVRLCGGLPLAVRIAAARLRNRPQWTFGRLADKLADGGRRLTELTVGNRSIEAAFELSYSRLSEAEQRVFRLLGEAPGVVLDCHGVAALGATAPDDAEQALENIVDASLLDTTAPDRYRLHDLAADYARQLATRHPEPEAPDRLLDYQLAAVSAAAELLAGMGRDVPDGMPFTDPDGAAEWFAVNRGSIVETVDYAVRVGRVDKAADLATSAADSFTKRSWFGDARRVLAAARAVTTDPQRSVVLLRSLANVHSLRGAYRQARTCFEQTCAAYVELGDLRNAAMALGGMGAASRALGLYGEAAECLTDVLGIARKLGDTDLECRALAGLGVLNGSLHRYDVADEQLRAAVKLSAGDHDLRTHTSALSNLGKLLRIDGPVDEATDVLNQVVTLATRIGDDVVRAFGLTNLGAVAARTGDLDTAIARHLSALDVVHPDAVASVIEIRNNLGAAYLAAGRTADAREQFVAVVGLTDSAPNDSARVTALDGLVQCR